MVGLQTAVNNALDAVNTALDAGEEKTAPDAGEEKTAPDTEEKNNAKVCGSRSIYLRPLSPPPPQTFLQMKTILHRRLNSSLLAVSSHTPLQGTSCITNFDIYIYIQS